MIVNVTYYHDSTENITIVNTITIDLNVIKIVVNYYTTGVIIQVHLMY